ncbi:MAG: hypothetical protein Kow0075_02120 [Salibacteraceae bacterium]
MPKSYGSPHVRKSFIFLLHLTLSLLVFSCTEHAAFERHVSEGVIEYEVTYPELDSNNIMLEMLPNRMIMKFKDNKYKSEMKAAAGIVEMSVLADCNTKTMYNLVKIFSERYVLKMNQAEALRMTDVLPPFQLEELDDTEIIAGARCKKVLLDFGAMKDESYIFAYTDEIDIKDPNWCTPYRNIQGVLLDYRIENYNMNMRLRAIRITPEPIDDSEFVVDERYLELNNDEFDKLVVRNMEMFME